jgi:hypothetical protein
LVLRAEDEVAVLWGLEMLLLLVKARVEKRLPNARGGEAVPRKAGWAQRVRLRFEGKNAG